MSTPNKRTRDTGNEAAEISEIDRRRFRREQAAKPSGQGNKRPRLAATEDHRDAWVGPSSLGAYEDMLSISEGPFPTPSPLPTTSLPPCSPEHSGKFFFTAS